ncbi:MAG: Holliday junction branch migration protein RuvA [candidate division WOR-3 bacterium]
MYYRIKGKLTLKRSFFCAIETGGIEYGITIPLKVMEKLPQEGSEVSLYILPIISEEKIELFGFLDEKQKNLFEKLISITGIGSKVALQILSHYDVDEFLEIIKRNEEKMISKIKGVGKKRASLILLEFKDYIFEGIKEGINIEEAISALTKLGLKRSEAKELVLKKLKEKKFEKTEDLIQEILKGE